MDLFIDNKSGAPIYDQIYTQIKDQIIQGALQPDEAMPSIRGLARDLRISVITTKRAYEDLEADGFITTMPGRGSFVAPQNPALHREESLKQMEEHLQHAIDAARRGGITKDEVRETLDLLWEES
jgi:GntR family transcriptional regulator